MNKMIKGIGHLAFNVEDMEKSLQFYCDAVGFEKAFELSDSNGEPWIVYVQINEGQFVELFYGENKRVQIDKNTSGYNHLCLEVIDIYEIANYLKSKGITLDVEPKQGKDLNYQCWAKDPDGNRIEFMQMNPQSPQLKKY